MATAYRDTHRGTHTRADWTTWAGNSIALLGVIAAIIAGAIGMLIAFGYVNEDSTTPFRDGLAWMFGGLIVAIVANVFRREHHVTHDTTSGREQNFAGDVDMMLGNGLGVILGGLAVASGVIGLLVHFEFVKDGNANAFDDAVVWFMAGGILAFCATTFRREHHVADGATTLTTTRREYETTRPDSTVGRAPR